MHVRRWDYLRSMNQWKTVGIVGAGTMGSGMAQIAAEAGCEVVLVDAKDVLAEALVQHVRDRALQPAHGLQEGTNCSAARDEQASASAC